MVEQYLKILPKYQKLQVIVDQTISHEFMVSTAANGLGEEINTGKTPRGWHLIRAKIGAGLPINSVFVGRRFTGELYATELRQQYPERDWILTRILWLSGLEVGKNKMGQVDTMRRLIYIHGCPAENKMGTPLSKGCIRMHNEDILELFEMVNVGTKVYIEEV